MRAHYRCLPLGACLESKRLTTLGSVRRYWTASDLPPSPWGAGVSTTGLTSIPGSTSIRVEGGP